MTRSSSSCIQHLGIPFKHFIVFWSVLSGWLFRVLAYLRDQCRYLDLVSVTSSRQQGASLHSRVVDGTISDASAPRPLMSGP